MATSRSNVSAETLCAEIHKPLPRKRSLMPRRHCREPRQATSTCSRTCRHIWACSAWDGPGRPGSHPRRQGRPSVSQRPQARRSRPRRARPRGPVTYWDLIRRPDVLFDGIWPRAEALPARQALETAMGELWASQPPSSWNVRMPLRSQELCLTAYPSTPARPAGPYTSSPRSAWPATTTPTNCLPPAAELGGWLDQATQVLTQI
jgi:hypothetical protein